MAGLRVHFVFPAGLVERVDAALTVGQSRGEFVRAAVEQALSEAKEPSAKQQADRGSVPSSEGVRSAAPAEQPADSFDPEMHQAVVPKPEGRTTGYQPEHGPVPFRRAGSVQAKRDVRPVPKAGEK